VRVLGRYELLRLIGRGGMAEVHLARRRVAGVEKRLVIKRIRAERATDPAFLELFLREAKLSMRLVHQNIVPVFDFGRDGSDVFLAMEHVDGIDLGAALTRGRLEPLVAAFVAAECCQALDYAHRGGGDRARQIVHRDVTPRNVLLSWSGEVKLTDFGVAGLAGDSGLRGTPAYMAPEQARGEPVDARCDVYALGLVLREMITGQRARRAGDVATLLDEARRGALPALPADIDAGLAAIIERATAADPDARTPSARALLDELDAFMVAARAAEPGAPAPARRLERVLAALRPAPGAGGTGAHAALRNDELGGATARSLAETQGDDETPPAAAAVTRSRRWPWLAAVAITAAGATTWALRAGEAPRPAPVALVSPDRPAPPPTTTPPVDAPPAPAIVAAPPDAGPSPTPPRRRPPAAAATPPPAAAPVRRRVTIGATPWAYFQVDADPTPHQTPETVELPPGRHRIRFSNPTLRVERVIELDVPADRDIRHVEPMAPPR
jgi:tRNA A-37 threonylcarbamoyl transferase component Bud32